MNERKVFEQYILTERGEAYLNRELENYSDHFVQEAWEAWQARSQVVRSSNERVSDEKLEQLLDFFEYRYTGRDTPTGEDVVALLSELQQRRSDEPCEQLADGYVRCEMDEGYSLNTAERIAWANQFWPLIGKGGQRVSWALHEVIPVKPSNALKVGDAP